MRLKKIEQANKLEYQEEMNRLRESFTKVLDFVKKYFPRGFRREKSKNSVARVVFEAISVGVYLALEKEPSLLNKEKVDTNWIRSKDFKDSVDQKYALHDAKRIMERINVVKDKLLNQ